MGIGQISKAQGDVYTLQKDISLRIAKVIDNWGETQRRRRQGLPYVSTYHLFLADLEALWHEIKYIAKSANKHKTHKQRWENAQEWFDYVAEDNMPTMTEARHMLDNMFAVLKYSGLLDLTWGMTTPEESWRENV